MQSQQQVGTVDYSSSARLVAVRRIFTLVGLLMIAGLVNPVYDELIRGPLFYASEIITMGISSFILFYIFRTRKKKDLDMMARVNKNLFPIFGVAMAIMVIGMYLDRAVPVTLGDKVSSLVFMGTSLAVCYMIPKAKVKLGSTGENIQRSFAKKWVLVFLSAYAVLSILDTWYDLTSGEIVFGPPGLGSFLHEYGIVFACGAGIAYFAFSHRKKETVEIQRIKKTGLVLMGFIVVAFMTKVVGIYLEAGPSGVGLQRDDIGVMVGLIAGLVQYFL